jgi:hypothetical protein
MSIDSVTGFFLGNKGTSTVAGNNNIRSEFDADLHRMRMNKRAAKVGEPRRVLTK